MPNDQAHNNTPPAGEQKDSIKKPFAKSKQGRQTKKIPIEPGPITRAQMLEAFKEAFKKGKHLPPSDEEISRLAGIFTHWKRRYYEHQRSVSLYETVVEATAEARQAIETLNQVLPTLLYWHHADVKAGDPFAKWQVKHLQALQDALQDALHDIATPQMPYPNDWRWLLTNDVLLKDLAPSFPDSGYSKTGPVARFLAKIIPLVTGEKVTAVAISTQITKRGIGDK